MGKPAFIRAVTDGLHVHANSPGAVTIQQAPLLGGGGADSTIILNREDARQVAAALPAFLSMHTDPLDLYFYRYVEAAGSVEVEGFIGPFASYSAANDHAAKMIDRYPCFAADLPARLTSPVLDPATAA
jgi:hypothetical protein